MTQAISLSDADLQNLSVIRDTLLTREPVDSRVAAVMQYLHRHRCDYHWVGIYLLDGQELVLGPYAGPATDHLRIPVGRGVCGTAVAEGKNQVVGDVSKLSNYLACNLDTKSEIVVLIKNQDDGSILGQIDVDGRRLHQFNAAEELFLSEVAVLLAAVYSSSVKQSHDSNEAE